MLSIRARLFPLLLLLGMMPLRAHAQAPVLSAPDPQQALVDRWLHEAVRAQLNRDAFNRYVGAPTTLLVGGALLVGTPLVAHNLHLTAATVVTALAAGALMSTSAIGFWAHSDPYAAQRWANLWGGAAFIAFGTSMGLYGIQVARKHPDNPSGRLLAAVGFFEVGAWASLLAVNVLLPDRSPLALQRELHDLAPTERYQRMHDFLAYRDHYKRMNAWATLPWYLPVAGVLFYSAAHDAATTGGRVLLYGLGGALAAFSIGSMIYEAVRTGDAERFSAGEDVEASWWW